MKSEGGKGLRLVMAGGGTGGHLFPAIALADEIRRRDPEAEVVFFGSRGGIEERVVPASGYALKLLNVEGLKRRSASARARALVKAARSTIEALRILREIRPSGVIGSGSYSSAPVVAAAKLLGIRTAILEQNALPGLTNRALGRFVDRVYIAFEEARPFFPGGRTVLTGNPIRRGIARREVRERSDKFSILVFGGSQGATAINAALIDSIEYLTDILSGLKIVHQTGADGFEPVDSAYKRKGLNKVEVHRFIDDMGAAYNSADLVVCRAGATSIAEITAVGLPAILIPYPFASDDHQTVNARCLSDRGAAVTIRQEGLTGASLAEAVRRLYENPGELKSMRHKARELGRPEAARDIADNFLNLIKRKR